MNTGALKTKLTLWGRYDPQKVIRGFIRVWVLVDDQWIEEARIYFGSYHALETEDKARALAAYVAERLCAE